MKYAILAAVLAAPLAFGQTAVTESFMPVDLSTRSSVVAGKSIFVFSATENEKDATIRLVNKLGATELWHLTLSGPINKNADNTELAGLHGLNGKAKIAFGLQKRFNEATATFNDTKENVNRWNELCHRANQPDGCDLFDPKIPQTEVGKLVKVSGLTQLVSLTAGYRSDTFRYLDATTLAAGKERHPGYSAEGAYSILPLWRNTLYSVSLKYLYQNEFDAGTEKQLCRPGVASSLECGPAIVGAPTRSRSRAIALESRWYGQGGFAIEPLISRDTVARTTSIELPIYFLRNGDGKLAGGVTVGWDSKERQVNAAIFVGSVLSALTK
jgi:hypothetical protein